MLRVLIVKLTSLGDVIHTLPAISDAAINIPNLELHWLVEESFHSIPGWHPAVSKVLTTATRRWRKSPQEFFTEYLNLIRQLRLTKYDVIIDAQGLLKSTMFSCIAKGRRAGYDKYSIKETFASYFYNCRASVPKNEHAIIRVRKLFSKVLGYRYSGLPDFGLTPDKFNKFNYFGKYLIYLHATTWPSKQWPVEYWQQLTDLAACQGYEVKLVWGDQIEHARALEIAEDRPNATVCPQMNLNEVAGMVSHARGVVSVDTGFGHLAAALSIPCVSLYGATDSLCTGTIGSYQKHLQAKFECSPCLIKKCSFIGHSNVMPACFAQFNPQIVWKHLEQLINKDI